MGELGAASTPFNLSFGMTSAKAVAILAKGGHQWGLPHHKIQDRLQRVQTQLCPGQTPHVGHHSGRVIAGRALARLARPHCLALLGFRHPE